jgi:hypothetical protein
MHPSLPADCQAIPSDFTNLESSRQILAKPAIIKLRDNHFSGSRVVPCGRTDRHGKLTAVLGTLAGKTKNVNLFYKKMAWSRRF